jgi:TctA family transporter
VLIISGIVGFLFRKIGPHAPLLGMILGPLLKGNFRRAFMFNGKLGESCRDYQLASDYCV